MINRPPLAAELFEDRPIFAEAMNKYPQMRPIIPRLRKVGASVEEELQRLQIEIPDYPMRHQQLAAVRYYLQEMLWRCTVVWNEEVHGITNHKTLVDDIRRWKKPGEQVCFVTFNYDMLLEDALREVDIRFDQLSSYISHKDFMLIKLHGSINWARVVATPMDCDRNKMFVAKELILRSGAVQISTTYQLIGEYPPPVIQNRALLPALAIPVESKLDFESPPDHVEALKGFIPRITKILVIGWRATERPFLELLKAGLKGRPHIYVVTGNEQTATASAKNLQNAGIIGRFQIAKTGFSEFTVNREAEGFLMGEFVG